MKTYKNTRTGAELISPIAISGKDWVEKKPESKPQVGKAKRGK